MPLTAEDVRNKRFTTVRLREGYDMSEVDQFLDEVEAEFRRLSDENEELRTKLNGGQTPSTETKTAPKAAATGDEPTVAVATDDASEETLEPSRPEPASTVAAGTSADTAAPVERLEVTTTAEASTAATRLLELAGRSADQLVSEAEAKAEQIVGEARTQAETLETQTEERRRTLISDIEQEKERLDHEIEGLRAFEREYRAELRTYFEEQLATLDGHGTGGVLGRAEGKNADGEHSGRSVPAQGTDQDGASSSSPLQSILRDDS